MISVDWLSIYQDHAGMQLPDFGSDLVLWADLETGHVSKRVVYGHQHTGSYDTSVRVRCSADRVEVSGNPSRFAREDNVWGCSSIEAALEVFNGILRELGLPEFSDSDSAYVAPRHIQGRDDVGLVGCRITRIDLNRNLSSGSAENARRFVNFLGGFRYERRAPESIGGSTVQWGGGSRYNTVKYYLKGDEMRAHARGMVSDSKRRLMEYVTDRGMIRHEVKLAATWLQRNGAQSLAYWSMERMRELIETMCPHKQIGVMVTGMDGIAERVESMGESPHVARQAEMFARLWAQGDDVRSLIGSRAKYYRYRRLLRGCGIDIAEGADVLRFASRVTEITLSEMEPPEWYKMVG